MLAVIIKRKSQFHVFPPMPVSGMRMIFSGIHNLQHGQAKRFSPAGMPQQASSRPAATLVLTPAHRSMRRNRRVYPQDKWASGHCVSLSILFFIYHYD
jgi:hypothetical protein